MATYGAYKSVNILPHFAAAVEANGGPFDPKVKVNVTLSTDGRYTLNGVDAFDADMNPQSGLVLKKFINNTINGVRYVSNGLLQIDSEGRRYSVYISDANGQVLPYSILMQYNEGQISYRVTTAIFPSDHPFLQAFVNVTPSEA